MQKIYNNGWFGRLHEAIMKATTGRMGAFQVFFWLILTPIVSYGQYEDSLLNVELKSFSKRGIDDVCIFGKWCQHCAGSNFNTYYLIYDSFSTVKVKEVIYLVEDFEARHVFDSTFLCKDCPVIMDYGLKNYDSLHKNLDGSNITFPTYINGEVFFTPGPQQGKSYYYGIYSRGTLDYLTVTEHKNINYLYDYHNECWVLISMMKNEFVR